MSAFDPGVLESLVGVTFTDGLVEYDAPNGALVWDALAGTIYFEQTYAHPARSVIVTAVTNQYTAAARAPLAGYYYYFPTFGSITLQNTSGPASTVTYYIHGVSSNGLFLTTAEFQLNDNASMYGIPGWTVTLTNDANPTYPLFFDTDASAYVAPVCFVEGARILTARGEVAVEDMVEGDEVVTADGGLRPAIWIGSRGVRCDRHPRPDETYPVRVRAGAFGDGLPARDLRLSPGHAVAIDGVLVPIGLLANGATIVQERVETVRYFHVELDAHDVILAEGLACESYLDDGNRQVFGNAPGHMALYGRLDPQDWDQACRPVMRQGPETEALRRRLTARAETLGWTLSRDAQVTLEADGQVLAPVLSAEGRVWFLAPAAERLVLRSPVSTPALATPGQTDPRRLGVALSGLRIDGQAVDLASETLDRGFHPLERPEAGAAHGAWRWTDGAAELPPTTAPSMIELEVLMVSPRWIAPDQTLNQASPLAPRLRLVEAG